MQRCLLLLSWSATACSRSVGVCPEGTVRAGDRCVLEGPSPPDDTDGERSEGLDASWALPSNDASLDAYGSEPDNTIGMDETPAEDATMVADASSALDATPGPDATPEKGATSASDATLAADAMHEGGVAPDAASDVSLPNEAAVDAGGDGTVPSLCSETDLASWRAFEASGQLIRTIATCYARNPQCAEGACDLASCLRQVAGVTDCVTCVAEETRCALAACVSECGSSASSDLCRACACHHGCVGTTRACEMGPVDVCADCNGTTCSNMSLSPVLIFLIVGGDAVL